MGLRKAQLPGQARVVDGTSGRRPGSAVVAGDQHDLGPGLRHAGGDGPHAGLGDQLDGNPGVPVGVFQVVDQLGQILDGINVMMGRRGDQADARRGVAGSGNPGIDLLPRQVAALSRLRALGHLDLDLVGADQIAAGHAKSSAGYLLDGRAAVLLRPFRGQALRRLAALTAVGFSMDGVHGQGQSLVGLLGNGSVGHGACLEPADDRLHRLHLLERHALFWIDKVQETAKIPGLLPIHQRGIFFKHTVIVFPYRLLEQMDGFRIVAVMLALASELVAAHAFQGQIRPQAQGIEGPAVEPLHVLLDILHGNALHPADCVGEIPINHFLCDSYRLKNLGALVGLDGGNSHLGGNLHNAA